MMTKNGLNFDLVKTFVTHYYTFKITFLLDLALSYTDKIVGIPMNTNCASLVADFVLFCSERDTVDSRYLDPSYLDPITYVELISKSRLFSLCIYCISASRMSNYFYVDTSAISFIIFSPWIYFS